MGDLLGSLVTLLPWILLIVAVIVIASSLLRIADALEDIAESLNSDQADDDDESTQSPE